MVDVYSTLDGFPKPAEQPRYYEMLARVGELTQKPGTELLVAASHAGTIAGAVVYFCDMQYYGSGGTATQEKNAAGFRLLAVDPAVRGQAAINPGLYSKNKENKLDEVIIHTPKP